MEANETVINRNPPEVMFFSDDSELSKEDYEKEIERLIKIRNDILVSKGYIIDENGNIFKKNMQMLDGVIGFAIGDALGVPVEFSTRSYLEKQPLKDMIGHGCYDVPEGTWSDDTALMLATIDSIIEAKAINFDDIMYKFSEWVDSAKYTATGDVFDIGFTTKKAISRFKYGAIATKCGDKDYNENGNGSLMRILPIVYYLYSNDFSEEEEVAIINNASSLTHAHEISCLGCKIYSDYIKQLLDGCGRKKALDFIKSRDYTKYYSKESINEYKRILVDDISLLSINDINSSGYVVDTLEASLWATLNSSSYEEAVLTAVNLGGDTDTIGAITGALNGMIYGREQIPERWIDSLKNKEYLYYLTDKFTDTLRDISRESKKESDSELDEMFSDEPVIVSSEVVDNNQHK